MNSQKTAVTNVHVFDGHGLRDLQTVVIDGGIIGTDPTGAQIIDGGGGVLLPGLIDAHVHLTGAETLDKFAAHGVTTALDMGTWPPSLVDSLRGRVGRTDIRSAGAGATSPEASHSKIPGRPENAVVTSVGDAERYVDERVAEGSDYIKIIVDIPGPSQEVLNALVDAAHAHGKLVVAHTVSTATVSMAQQAKVDVLTHAPMNEALDQVAVDLMLAEGRIIIPTLTMMRGVVENSRLPEGERRRGPRTPDYASARTSVALLHAAGVPILAGSDANEAAGVPSSPPHGESLHDELELLVDAGLSTVEVLRAATSLTAHCFGLDDRGAIEPGRRADLLLIDGDPIADITATRSIRRVWCAGIEYERP